MKAILLSALCLATLSTVAQEIITLPKTDDSEVTWETPEREYFSEIWKTQVVTNVSQPTMQVFRPSPEINTGTAVIVAPGGALYALSTENEGSAVAEWLAEKGITAFVLKYRLVPTGEDGTAEVMQTPPNTMFENVAKVMPYSVTDGLNAIQHVRDNAADYGIQPDRIGFLGFSAGGAVTMGVGYEYEASNKPNFLVPVYAWTDAQPVREPKSDMPPMFIICATDDPLDLAKGSVELYSAMLQAKKNVALHMYARGGHGFGMFPQGKPSDTWIERFYEWAVSEKLVTTTAP